MIRKVTLAALAALAPSACQGCREDHPYVPYTIGVVDPKSSAAPSGLEPAPSGSAEEAGAAFAQQAAAVAPPESKTWTLDGLALAAPEGTFFQLGLARDLDGDGAVDVLAVVRGKSPGDPAQVVFYAGLIGCLIGIAEPAVGEAVLRVAGRLRLAGHEPVWTGKKSSRPAG